LAGGLNAYGFANGDPLNFSDPFGLTPAAAACAIPVVAPVCVSTATLVGGAVVLAATNVGILLSGRHRRAVSRTQTSLDIAGAHIAAAASGPPNGDEDPNWMKDKLDDARKHLNNARKYVKDALGKRREELQREIDRLQKLADDLANPPAT
jgi:hypothetical protein